MSKKEETITKVEELPGVGETTAEKLKEAGFNDLISIAVSSPATLADIAGVGEAVARKMINTARNSLDMGFESGEQLLERAAKVERITTGSKELDKLLGGGVETGTITETYGQYASGKCVSKDTNLVFFNPDKIHLSAIEEVYEKYSTNEIPYENGFVYDLKSPIQVIGIDKNGMTKISNVSKLFKEHVKTLLRIETERGAIIKVTERHPLLSLGNDGISWKSSGLLKEGDFIGTPKKTIKIKDHNLIDENDAYFLGLFVAEGTSNPLSITNYNEETINWLVNYIRNKFSYEPTVSRNGKIVLFRTKTKEFLMELGNTKSGTKFIPETVMNGNRKIIEAFICGYIDGDGYIGKAIEMATKSKRLSTELSYLLSLLEIKTAIKNKIINGCTYYRVYVTDHKSKNQIIEIMRKSIIKKNYDIVEKDLRNCSADGIPLVCAYPAITRIYSKITGSRRRINKWNKKTLVASEFEYIFRHYLAANPKNEKISNDTLNLFLKFCVKRFIEISNAKTIIDKEHIKKEEINSILKILPFATKEIANELGLKRTTMQNYITRNLPNKKILSIKEVLIRKIDSLFDDKGLKRDLELLKTLIFGNIVWEKIESINKIDYNDFVYDLTVPDIHNFVAGNKPVFMHNSQISYQLTVNAQLPKEKGGVNGAVVFLDTESTFRPERIKQIAEAQGLDYKEVLKNIRIVKCFNSDHQMLLAEKVPDLITKEGLPVKLVIVDSLMSLFRSEYLGRGQLSERQQKINKHIHTLKRMADMYNIAVYVTNQVMAKPDTFFGDPTEPIGGNIVAHGMNPRIYLRKGKKGTRVAKLVDSSYLPEAECIFKITEQGIKDVDEKD